MDLHLNDLYAALFNLHDAHKIAYHAGRDDLADEISRAAKIVTGIIGLAIDKANYGHQDREQ